jgi:polysaccharide biosynthesis/export protein
MRVPINRIVTSVFALCLLAIAFTASAQERQRPRLTNFDEGRYRIQPGDVLEVQYRYSPEFNQTVSVQPDGYVSLQIGGDVRVADLTVDQARQLILKKASERLRDPEATLILKEFQKPSFVVAGEVAKPGQVEMRGRVTALQAIMLAGGFKEGAKSSQVIVFRRINTDMAEVKALDLKSIKRTSDLENDLTLQPGDMVFVPRDKITKIERFMRIASIAALISPRL